MLKALCVIEFVVMDDLLEELFKGLLRGASLIVRFLVWLLWGCCFEIIGWFVGWPVLRALTFNKFPTQKITEYEHAQNLTAFMVCMFGLAILVLIGAILAKLIIFTGA